MTKTEIFEALKQENWPPRVIDEMLKLVSSESVNSIEEFHAAVIDAQQKRIP